MNAAPAMGASVLCSACNQPISLSRSAPPPPKPPTEENTLLLRDAVRSLRLIAMYVGVLVANVFSVLFWGSGDDWLDWSRRIGVFVLTLFVAGWIVLTRRRIV